MTNIVAQYRVGEKVRLKLDSGPKISYAASKGKSEMKGRSMTTRDHLANLIIGHVGYDTHGDDEIVANAAADAILAALAESKGGT